MRRKVLVLVRREYLAMVRTKGFWIATLTLPILMAALMVIPGLVLATSETSQRLAVVDETGRLAAELTERLSARSEADGRRASFEVSVHTADGDAEALRRRLDERVLTDQLDAWIWLDERTLSDGRVEYHAESVSNFITQVVLEDEISEVVRRQRLEAAGYDADRIGELTRSVRLKTSKITEEGTREEGAMTGFLLAYALFFLLYLVIIIYGQQVMNAVLEEKSSRVVEVVVSSVRPFELMIGKLVGVCLAGLTQLAVWFAAAIVLTLPAVVQSMAWIPEGFEVPTIPLSLAVHTLLFFVLGFFVYASLYAAVGAAFNTVQEAQQYVSVAVVVLVSSFFFLFVVINDPDSTVSVVSSLVPLYTPLLMLLRIAVETPPGWQIALGYLLTIGFIVFMVWLCGRIYRVGILMYGKKPTVQEIWRWLRHA